MLNIIAPARNYSLNMQTQKKANLAWRSRRRAQRNLLWPLLQVILAPGNWMRTPPAFLPAHCTCTIKEPFLRRKGSRKLFLPIHRTGEGLLQKRSSKMVTRLVRHMIKKNDNLMQQFTGNTMRAETAERVRKTSSTRCLRRRLTRFEYCEDYKKP